MPSPSCSRVVSRCSTRPRTSSPAGTRLCRPDAFPILVPRIRSLRIRSSASVPRRVPLDPCPLSASLGAFQNPRCPIAPKFGHTLQRLSRARPSVGPGPCASSALQVRAKSQRPSQSPFGRLGPSAFSIALQVPSVSSRPPNTRSSYWVPRVSPPPG